MTIATARKCTSLQDPELVLFMVARTGELLMEGVIPGEKPSFRAIETYRQYRTGLVFSEDVSAKIWQALERTGVEVYGISNKCFDLNLDIIDQLLFVMYPGIEDLEENWFDFLGDLSFLWRLEADMEKEKDLDLELLDFLVAPPATDLDALFSRTV